MKLGDLRHAGCSDAMVSAKLNGRNFPVTGRLSRKLNACLVCEAQTPAALDCFATLQLRRPVSSMGCTVNGSQLTVVRFPDFNHTEKGTWTPPRAAKDRGG